MTIYKKIYKKASLQLKSSRVALKLTNVCENHFHYWLHRIWRSGRHKRSSGRTI